jgi:hypothetical protein
MIYKGPYDMDEIRRFVIEVSQSLKNKQKFTKGVVRDDSVDGHGGRKALPLYTIGQPKIGDEDNVCYLQLGEAYQKK